MSNNNVFINLSLNQEDLVLENLGEYTVIDQDGVLYQDSQLIIDLTCGFACFYASTGDLIESPSYAMLGCNVDGIDTGAIYNGHKFYVGCVDGGMYYYINSNDGYIGDAFNSEDWDIDEMINEGCVVTHTYGPEGLTND
jgi:hypothetical protein